MKNSRNRLVFAACALLEGLVVACCMGQQPELHDVDLSKWDCARIELLHSSGAKNRPWIDLTNTNVPQWDYETFIAETRKYDEVLAGIPVARTEERTRALRSFENQTVSLTGWVNLASPSWPEPQNCMDRYLVDWHVEVSPRPLNHPLGIGDLTPIVCEITPFTEGALYRAGVRMLRLAAYTASYQPTGSKPHRVRVSGYLFCDDSHGGSNYVGRVVTHMEFNGRRPERATAWEIHPIVRIEDLGTQLRDTGHTPNGKP